MKLDRSDFTQIRTSILSTILMLVLSACLVWVSRTLHQSAILEQAVAGRQLNEFESKLRQVQSEENEIRQKTALFRELQARGILSEERRLDWAELIKDIRDQRKLLDVHYEFAPQKVLDNKSDGDYSFRSSAMRLRMKLLHEDDLLHIINDLRNTATALVRVRSCNVSRMSRGESTQGEVAQLMAECELEWITILPSAKKARE